MSNKINKAIAHIQAVQESFGEAITDLEDHGSLPDEWNDSKVLNKLYDRLNKAVVFLQELKRE